MVMVGVALAGGLVLLAVAPDRFVAGSAGLAGRWGVSRVVIGAVVIGFGTSAPELVVSGLAAADGQPEVGIGNVIGSNMANLGLVVGAVGLMLAITALGAIAMTRRRLVTRPEASVLLLAYLAVMPTLA